MPLRRTLGVLAGVGLFLSPVAIERGEAPSVAADARVAPASVREPASHLGPAASSTPAPRLPAGPIAVRASGARLRVFPGPSTSSGSRVVPAVNPWGQRLAFPVIDRVRPPGSARWVRVLLGVRPNGVSGWVPASRVEAKAVRDRVVVDLSARSLRRWRDGRLAERFTVAVGAPASPTPAGRFFVWARLDTPADGPYGTFVLGLSGFPSARSDAPGGARIAIHGTTDPTDLGRAVSHGCIRVLNAEVLRLRDLPLGATVVIRR